MINLTWSLMNTHSKGWNALSLLLVVAYLGFLECSYFGRSGFHQELFFNPWLPLDQQHSHHPGSQPSPHLSPTESEPAF